MVAYWLIPAETARSFFVSTIGKLAARFDGPVFEPHVTIYVTRKGEDIPAEVLNRALVGYAPFRLSVRNLQYSDSFAKAVFVQFEPNSLLVRLSHAFQQASSLHDAYHLSPHLSLIYKKMTGTAKLDVSASVRLPFAEVHFDLAQAVICPVRTESHQDVKSWRIAAVHRLTE